MTDLALSVLDQSPIAEGSTGSEALHNTIDLAQLADRLGYHRYWVAEHHGGPMLAGPSPEVLIGPIASATERIRVGSGGVMLPHYSPLKVAESFSLLAGLYPERIDLALGRASGTDPMTAFALQRDRRQPRPTTSPAAGRAAGLPGGPAAADHPFARLAQGAARAARGARAVAARLVAAERGLGRRAGPSVRVRRLHQPRGAPIAELYRDEFVDSERLAAPRHGDRRLGGGAENEEEARDAGLASMMAMRELRARPADPRAAGGEGAAVPGAERRRRARRAAAAA